MLSLGAVMLTACVAAGAGRPLADPTVSSLNVTQYTGVWYQMYGSLTTEVVVSRYCVTATYGVNPNGTVSVFNAERVGSVDGSRKNISGYATVPDASEPGRLEVSLQGPPFPAGYWVYELGPASYNGYQYEYSIISNQFRDNLFVLARDVKRYEALYEAKVNASLVEKGFVFEWNKPIKTFQEGCTY